MTEQNLKKPWMWTFVSASCQVDVSSNTSCLTRKALTLRLSKWAVCNERCRRTSANLLCNFETIVWMSTVFENEMRSSCCVNEDFKSDMPLLVSLSLSSRLALYVYEYLLHVGAQKSAQTFLSEVRCYFILACCSDRVNVVQPVLNVLGWNVIVLDSTSWLTSYLMDILPANGPMPRPSTAKHLSCPLLCSAALKTHPSTERALLEFGLYHSTHLSAISSGALAHIEILLHLHHLIHACQDPAVSCTSSSTDHL